MLDLSRVLPGHLEETLGFAAKVDPHLEEASRLTKNLAYLGGYSCTREGETDYEHTRCTLFKDFAPHSFTFNISVRKQGTRYRCTVCDGAFTFVERDPQVCPECGADFAAVRRIEAEGAAVDYRHWLSGGLIYHGPPTADDYPTALEKFKDQGRVFAGWSTHT